MHYYYHKVLKAKSITQVYIIIINNKCKHNLSTKLKKKWGEG